MSTPALTHTGILGGMDLAVILGIDMPYWREAAGLTKPFDDHYVILSDFREAEVDDDGALPIVENSNITWLKGDAFENESLWQEAVNRLAAQVDALYLHIDADVLTAGMFQTQPVWPPAVLLLKPSCATSASLWIPAKLVYGTYGFYFDRYSRPGLSHSSGLRVVSAGLDSWKQMPFN